MKTSKEGGVLNDNSPTVATLFFIGMITSTIFFLSDWNILIADTNIKMNVGDLLSILLLVFLLKNLKNENNHTFQEFMENKTIKTIFLVLFIHLVLQLIFNIEGNILTVITRTTKVIFYITLIYLLVNSFDDHENTAFVTLEIMTIILMILGFYIVFAILMSSRLSIPVPYEFLWKFTRQDSASYLFRDEFIIRNRSLFSEPSYYGVYLNFVLMVLSTEKKTGFKYKYTKRLIIISILSTLALAPIFTVLVYLGFDFIKKISKIENVKNKIYIILTSFLVIIVVIFISVQVKGILYQSILVRLLQIKQGNDNSAYQRIIQSWSYIKKPIVGNGIGNTPAIWNNLAYLVSDFGVLIILPAYLFLEKYIIKSLGMKTLVLFLLIQFSKGGYLSSFNFSSMLYIILLSKGDFNERQKIS